jgi:hypothetical protein
MLIRIVIRRILLVLFALMLNSCTLAQYYHDSQQYRDLEFFRRYRPPTGINGREFNSPVTALPDRARLITGDGYEYEVGSQRHRVVMNHAAYFVPGDVPPFDPPARVTSVEYLYCALGDAPTECGGKITYESEEVFGPFAQWSCVPPACGSTIEDLSKIRKTNHELIIGQVVSKHGRQQKGENDTRVFTEEDDGTITRSAPEKNQTRIWCDFSKGVPKKCKRSIMALFDPSIGRGTILYIDEKMYDYLRGFEATLKHRHPDMNVIRRGKRYSLDLSLEEQAWWVGRLSQDSPHAFIAWENLQTEIQLEARAKAAGKPRPRTPRTLTEAEFKREWVTAWVNLEIADTADQAYWFGYLEALLDRDFNHQYRLTDEAHKKWTVLSKEILSTVSFVGDGYVDGLVGIREPRDGVSSYPNWKPGEMNCCEDGGMKLLRKN